jgi:hypothetical protein
MRGLRVNCPSGALQVQPGVGCAQPYPHLFKGKAIRLMLLKKEALRLPRIAKEEGRGGLTTPPSHFSRLRRGLAAGPRAVIRYFFSQRQAVTLAKSVSLPSPWRPQWPS